MNRVYLAGPMTGLTYLEASVWRNWTSRRLAEFDIGCFNPFRGIPESEFDNSPTGDKTAKNIFATQRGIVSRDFADVIRSDVVLANLRGARKHTIGTCFEMAWAYLARIPLVVVMEEDGSVFDHPFVREAANWIVRDLETAVEVICSLTCKEYSKENKAWKNMSSIPSLNGPKSA